MRYQKIYLDRDLKCPSVVNDFLDCRDGIIECYEYTSDSGYGQKSRIYLCQNTKNESVAVVRQTFDGKSGWSEEYMSFDSDSFRFLSSLIKGDCSESSGTYILVRDYTKEQHETGR